MTSVAGKLVLVATIAYGAFLVIGGALSIGGLVAVTMLAMAALAPLDRLAAVLVDYHRGRDAIDALMRVSVERPDGVAFAGSNTVAGGIAFQDVHFRYPGQPTRCWRGSRSRLSRVRRSA
jgi:ATP-binding cassette subfamily C protein LapB